LPFRSEHAARQLPPERFSRFARKQLAPGVFAILGIDGSGTSQIQSLRFEKTRFSPVEARAWLARHGFQTGLEEALDDRAVPEWM
jgi:hypothetical protein